MMSYPRSSLILCACVLVMQLPVTWSRVGGASIVGGGDEEEISETAHGVADDPTASGSTGRAQEGMVRLLGGRVEGTGNVYVYQGGRWGVVCDDGWTQTAANVVCRMLGFPLALGHTVESYFGVPERVEILLDNVRCYGSESHLLDCVHNDFGDDDCDLREAAGVFCSPRSNFAPYTHPPTSPTAPPTQPAPSIAHARRRIPTTRQPQIEDPITRRHTNRVHSSPNPIRVPYDSLRPSRTNLTGPAPTRPRYDTRRNATRGTRPPVVTAAPTRTPRRRPTRTPPTPTPSPAPGLFTAPPRGEPGAQADQQQPGSGEDGLLPDSGNIHIHQPEAYSLRLAGGRTPEEGRVEIQVDGVWGAVCADRWTLLEATVACRHLGLGYARTAIQTDFFGGADLDKLVAGIECDGVEELMSACYHHQYRDVICPAANKVAGVICALELPDLVPNATLLETSSYLQDQPLYYLQCAMEENCAAASAFTIKKTYTDWHLHRRRLLRFSSSTWNLGTADFRPFTRKDDWDWHLCHMHYHSMEVFAHYDLLDLHGNRKAQGHKASFCLEDVQCAPGVNKHYICKGYGDQGISVGCADDYLHDIDCQWIDITDVEPGEYIFKVHINPEIKVAELSYENNAVTCNLLYTGNSVRVTNCQLGRG